MRARLGWPASLGAALAVGLAAIPAGTASASGTHDLAVGATVLSKNKCQFTNAGPTQLSFGAIDPSVPAVVTATASTTFRCVGSDATAVYQITSDDGLYAAGAGAPRMQHATDPARFLPYALDLPRTGTAPKGDTLTLTVTGTIQPADFQNAPGGAYADTVVLTITP